MAHQMWQDHPYSQRSNATKGAVGVEAEGDGEEWEGWTKFEKGGVDHIWVEGGGGLHKIGR